MTDQNDTQATATVGNSDPYEAAVEMLLILARLHSRGGICISGSASPEDKETAEAILEDLADLADNLPSCRNGRTH